MKSKRNNYSGSGKAEGSNLTLTHLRMHYFIFPVSQRNFVSPNWTNHGISQKKKKKKEIPLVWLGANGVSFFIFSLKFSFLHFSIYALLINVENYYVRPFVSFSLIVSRIAFSSCFQFLLGINVIYSYIVYYKKENRMKMPYQKIQDSLIINASKVISWVA